MAEAEKEDKPELSLEGRSGPASYAILGCGSVGKEVAETLDSRGEEFYVVDIDQDRVLELRDSGYEAFEGDITELDVVGALGLEELNAVLILSSDPVANEEAVEHISRQSEEVTIIARALDPVSEGTLDEAGASIVIRPSKVISEAAIRFLERAEASRRARKLENIVAEASSFGIVLHDNPDPDTMAGGMALKRIAEAHGVPAEILHGGEVTHQQNRAMVNLLDIEMTKLPGDPEEVERIVDAQFDTTVFVEHAVPGENNPFPKSFTPTIVIDHHQVEDEEVEAEFVDIRTDAGSVSTIFTKYLQELDLVIDDRLAAALLYGIRVDTNWFKRNTNPADLTAAAFLNPLADRDLLDKMESPSMSKETMEVLGDAIKNRQVVGSYLFSNVGTTQEKDALPQAADYLLQLEGVSTVLVYALTNGDIQVSARSKDVRINIGEVLSEAYGEVGSAGGHSTMAGAQIPVDVFGDIADERALLKLVEESITNRFIDVVGVEA